MMLYSVKISAHDFFSFKLSSTKDFDIFDAVHGGIGENGTLQAILESQSIPYTGKMMLRVLLYCPALCMPGQHASKISICPLVAGSGVEASCLCADKAATGAALSHVSENFLDVATTCALTPRSSLCFKWPVVSMSKCVLLTFLGDYDTMQSFLYVEAN